MRHEPRRSRPGISWCKLTLFNRLGCGGLSWSVAVAASNVSASGAQFDQAVKRGTRRQQHLSRISQMIPQL